MPQHSWEPHQGGTEDWCFARAFITAGCGATAAIQPEAAPGMAASPVLLHFAAEAVEAAVHGCVPVRNALF